MYQMPTTMMWFDQKAYQKALTLILEAIADERSDELYYDQLIRLAPTKEEKNILKSIRNDERKHREIFKKMYEALTNQAPVVKEEPVKRVTSYKEGLKQALFGELEAVETYRDIYKGLPQQVYRDYVFDIILDELKHASKFNYLLLEAHIKRSDE